MATSGPPGNGGAHSDKPEASSFKGGTEKASLHLETARTLTRLLPPMSLLTQIATSAERRAVAEDGPPQFRNSFPQPGDSPIYRAPVPLAPRVLRVIDTTLPLLVSPRETSPLIIPPQESEQETYGIDKTLITYPTASNMSTEDAHATSEDSKNVNDPPKKSVS
ncbi:hypothetical protein PENVUL_c006G04848 [Penicillium vulpinum]|uniref:Uncharacterized protein n=1 Tax=Penicillium vulpinum TaxID=29845 RepID=A0A1V6S7A1_9EURO|nr:hypothetical protein PENVUL_c006G04848 [Penicillium vulpinum]